MALGSDPRFQEQVRLPLHLKRQLFAFKSEDGLLVERDVPVSLENADEKNLVLNVPLALLDIFHEAFQLGSKI
ncbi:hypothetical protein N2603_28660 [Bradyrhizobium huanghuaihaiense]|uniref:hypothetical protein n=1 Tax=Bradyrhizobium huanghuaihaiense TaxID=990078 RepID=UPI0021AA0968|nr:hypothetical protein [Bradyrhizobium sp. CB3035]UWU74021.1 hypothetical protein N2603_28660 [Bradyrhizobium sp. CB3035]